MGPIFFQSVQTFFLNNVEKLFFIFWQIYGITGCQYFGIYLLNKITGKLLPIFSKFNNECTANIDCSWALDILDDFSKFHSAHFTLKYQKFGKKWRKFFLHWTLLLVLREGPTYSANLSIRDHMLCLIKIGPQNMGPTYWESPHFW